MGLARLLTRGADVWLNTPRPPLEASGTSGMKAALNGVLHCSTLDGWWPEGCEHGVTGWAIGDGAEGEAPEELDARDHAALFRILETEMLPAYADRPRWLAMMRASIRMAADPLLRRAHGPRLLRPPLRGRLTGAGAGAEPASVTPGTSTGRSARPSGSRPPTSPPNREGRLSPRQTALLRAGRARHVAVPRRLRGGDARHASAWWPSSTGASDTPGGWGGGVGVAHGVAVVVIAIGYVASRRHLSAAGSRQLQRRRGPVEVLSETRAGLPGADRRNRAAAAGRGRRSRRSSRGPSTACTTWPVPWRSCCPARLSPPAACRAGGRAIADADADAAEHAAASAQIAVVRRGYVIVVLLGLLALGIPVAGVLVGDLPARLRPLAWIGLLVVAIGFAWLAIAWLTSGPRRRV